MSGCGSWKMLFPFASTVRAPSSDRSRLERLHRVINVLDLREQLHQGGLAGPVLSGDSTPSTASTPGNSFDTPRNRPTGSFVSGDNVSPFLHVGEGVHLIPISRIEFPVDPVQFVVDFAVCLIWLYGIRDLAPIGIGFGEADGASGS